MFLQICPGLFPESCFFRSARSTGRWMEKVVLLDELWRRKMYIPLMVEEVCPPAMVVVLVEPLLAAMEVRSEAVVRKKDSS
jgi:hypothetical protein